MKRLTYAAVVTAASTNALPGNFREPAQPWRGLRVQVLLSTDLKEVRIAVLSTGTQFEDRAS